MKEITKLKLHMIIPSGFIMWAILFGASLLLDGLIIVKLAVTFAMTFIGCIAVWNMHGEEYDPDMMP